MSISWLFFIPIFTPSDFVMGFIFLVIGIICNIFGLWKNEVKKIDKKYLIIFVPLFASVFIIEFPYVLGPIILSIGIISYVITSSWLKYKTINQVWPGFFFSGIILTFQACIFPVYVIFASRYHSTNFLSQFISAIGNIFGLKSNLSNGTIFIGAIESNLPLTLSWETLGLYIWINFFIGTVLLFLFITKTKRKKIGIYAIEFSLITVIYLALRYIFSISILTELIDYQLAAPGAELFDVFYNPMFLFLSFIPFALILMKVIPLENITINLDCFKTFRVNKNLVIASAMIFLLTFSAVGSYAFQDPGTEKQGRILIDEVHSDWEDTTREVDKEWYGMLSTYNYYSWAEWLKHYYTIDKNINSTLTSEILKNYDILILKCPTNPYSDDEVQAIVQFVEGGGGLYLIGDHTNVFGMNSYLNQIAKNFGIEFNSDSTYVYSAIGGFTVYTPPKTLPHTIVQYVSQFQFLTSCSLDVPLTAENVMIGTEMIAHPGTYATKDFFARKKTGDQTRGLFLLCTALKYGKGRIVAFTDSTTFSTYCIFLGGYKSFNLGTIEYLNRENKHDYLNVLFLVIAIISFIATVFFLKKEKKILAIFLFISIVMISFPIATSTFSYTNKTAYPVPEPARDFDRLVCFDMEHSGAIITVVPSFESGEKLQKALKERYLTFFVWTQRVGCTPSLEDSMEDAINNGDLIVIINPIKTFTEQEKISLSEYLKRGGKLLLMDSIYNFNSTANELLSYFNMRITTCEHSYKANIAGTKNELFQSGEYLSAGAITQSRLTISGGRSILVTDDDQTLLSTKNVGGGILAVFVDSSTFSDWKMGSSFTIPNNEQMEIYNTDYYILENLLLDEEDVDPAEMNGYVYIDSNNNDKYDVLEDNLLLNVNITVWKIDNFYSGTDKLQFRNYFTSQEISVDNTGYYHLSNMTPGYYKVNALLDDFLIHESYVYLPSGNTTYNISKAEPAAVAGTVYYDTNGNGEYTAGEEISDVKVDIIYQKLDIKGEKVIEEIMVDTIQTDSTGSYSFHSLIPGWYIVNATKLNSTTEYLDYGVRRTIAIIENETTTFNISMSLVPITINGYTKYYNETKGNITIYFLANNSIENNTANEFRLILTNDTGFYTLEILPGYYNISVNETVHEDGQDVIYHFTGQLELHIGEGITSFDIALTKKES